MNVKATDWARGASPEAITRVAVFATAHGDHNQPRLCSSAPRSNDE